MKKSNCIHCEQVLTDDNRSSTYKRGYTSNVCKSCLRDRSKKATERWRVRHPERSKLTWQSANYRAALRYDAIKERYVRHIGGCQLCGYADFRCLAVFEFHHTADDKEHNLSRYRKTINFDTFHKEAQKCIVVCANCHRKLHHGGIITAKTAP